MSKQHVFASRLFKDANENLRRSRKSSLTQAVCNSPLALLLRLIFVKGTKHTFIITFEQALDKLVCDSHSSSIENPF